MNKTLLASLGLAAVTAIAPDRATAHGSVLSVPNWCAQQLGGGQGVPDHHAVKPGEFPGPASHFKMTNMELGSFDLGREIPALKGRDVRARFWLMEPGGMIAEHCHSDRPAFVYLLTGEVVETIEIKGKPVKRIIRAGESVPEHNGTHHWWVNQGKMNVLMVAIDLPNGNRPTPKPLPQNQSKGLTVNELDGMLLREEYPHIPDAANYKLQGRLVTVDPDGRLGLVEHVRRPGVTYVVSGMLLEHRSDQESPLIRRAGDISLMSEGLWNWWENKSQDKAVLLVVEFEDCGACQ
jgi:quercetin dioxygenase-like cupin family protein